MQSTSDHFFVYVTFDDEAEAHNIAGLAIEDRLAACANLIPGMQSIYHWEGQIQTDQEFILILKTHKLKLKPLEELIHEKHSYDCPCIVALPITAGAPDFLRWIAEATGTVGGNQGG